MSTDRSSATGPPLGARGGAARLRHDERGAMFLPMTGIVAVLLGLSAVISHQLGITGSDAGAVARDAAAAGAATLRPQLSGLKADEARSRVAHLDPQKACGLARATARPGARLTSCSIIDGAFTVAVITTDAPTSLGSASVPLTDRLHR